MNTSISQTTYFIILIAIITLSIGFLITPIGAGARSTTIGDAFGANIHLRQRASDAHWETIMRAAEAAGVEWGREQFNWDILEPTDDEFSWTVYDAVIDKYEEHDIKPLGLLTYSSQWASSNPGSDDFEFYYPDINAWEDYVGTVAEHYKGRVDHWEIWNEPNLESFWKSDVEQYATHFAVAVDAIKEVNPDAKVVLGGLSGTDADFLNELYGQLNDKSDIDIVAIHPYRVLNDNFNYAPEQSVAGLNSLFIDLYNIKAVINRNGQKGTPIWITETGWTTYDEGVSNRTQAQYLMRFFSIALAVPDVKKVFWYTLFDDSTNEYYAESQFGMLDDDYSPKLAEDAFGFTKNNLKGSYFKDQSMIQRTIIDNFIKSAGWQFRGTVCTNGTLHDSSYGKLKVSYRFMTADNCYAPISLQKTLPSKTRMLQFKAKGNNDDTLLRVRMTDSQGETFQYNLGFMPKEWLYYNIQLSEYASHWGGDNDGIIDQPVTFDSFVLDDTDGSYARGTVYFDELYSSLRGNTYLYRYHKGNKDIYAYWTSRKPRTLTIELTGAGRMREKRWRKVNKLKESGNARYKISADRSVKYLQTL